MTLVLSDFIRQQATPAINRAHIYTSARNEAFILSSPLRRRRPAARFHSPGVTKRFDGMGLTSPLHFIVCLLFWRLGLVTLRLKAPGALFCNVCRDGSFTFDLTATFSSSSLHFISFIRVSGTSLSQRRVNKQQKQSALYTDKQEIISNFIYILKKKKKNQEGKK